MLIYHYNSCLNTIGKCNTATDQFLSVGPRCNIVCTVLSCAHFVISIELIVYVLLCINHSTCDRWSDYHVQFRGDDIDQTIITKTHTLSILPKYYH